MPDADGFKISGRNIPDAAFITLHTKQQNQLLQQNDTYLQNRLSFTALFKVGKVLQKHFRLFGRRKGYYIKLRTACQLAQN